MIGVQPWKITEGLMLVEGPEPCTAKVRITAEADVFCLSWLTLIVDLTLLDFLSKPPNHAQLHTVK